MTQLTPKSVSEGVPDLGVRSMANAVGDEQEWEMGLVIACRWVEPPGVPASHLAEVWDVYTRNYLRGMAELMRTKADEIDRLLAG